MDEHTQNSDEIAERIVMDFSASPHAKWSGYQLTPSQHESLKQILSRELASLIADKQRIDWLEKCQCDLSHRDYVDVKIPRKGSTLRLAIDAAMKK